VSYFYARGSLGVLPGLREKGRRLGVVSMVKRGRHRTSSSQKEVRRVGLLLDLGERNDFPLTKADAIIGEIKESEISSIFCLCRVWTVMVGKDATPRLVMGVLKG